MVCRHQGLHCPALIVAKSIVRGAHVPPASRSRQVSTLLAAAVIGKGSSSIPYYRVSLAASCTTCVVKCIADSTWCLERAGGDYAQAHEHAHKRHNGDSEDGQPIKQQRSERDVEKWKISCWAEDKRNRPKRSTTATGRTTFVPPSCLEAMSYQYSVPFSFWVFLGPTNLNIRNRKRQVSGFI